MKSKMFKTLALFLALVCLISASSVAFAVTDAQQVYRPNITPEDIERGYVLGEIFVLLKPEYNDYPVYEELFPELEVTVLRIINGKTSTYLVLGISDKTEQGVLDAVELVSNNPCVKAAEPCYVGQIAEPVEKIKGDVNGDGTLSNADIILISRYIVGATKLNGSELALADANGDGTVTNADLIIFARKIVGIN